MESKFEKTEKRQAAVAAKKTERDHRATAAARKAAAKKAAAKKAAAKKVERHDGTPSSDTLRSHFDVLREESGTPRAAVGHTDFRKRPLSVRVQDGVVVFKIPLPGVRGQYVETSDVDAVFRALEALGKIRKFIRKSKVDGSQVEFYLSLRELTFDESAWEYRSTVSTPQPESDSLPLFTPEEYPTPAETVSAHPQPPAEPVSTHPQPPAEPVSTHPQPPLEAVPAYGQDHQPAYWEVQPVLPPAFYGICWVPTQMGWVPLGFY